MQSMMQPLRHRCGKSGHDLYTHKNLQIGLCSGQFFTDASRSTFVGIDGMLTNTETVYSQLLQAGHPCKTKDSQEILFYAYKEWGSNLFEHVGGDFVVLILDQQQKKLILCRDRVGKRSLYWYQDANFFLFASELKALLATGIIPQSPAMDGLGAYLYFGFIPQDMSPIQGVNKLLPAHTIEISLDGKKSISSYWSYSSYFQNQKSLPLGQIVTDLDLLVRKNIENALSCGGKIGCFLSGGEGAASMAYYASQTDSKQNLTAYSLDFFGENHEELALARRITADLSIPHEISSVDANNFLNDLLKILWHLDEPLADPHILSTWRLNSLAARESTTVLSSMGCEELFAGHPRYSLRDEKWSFEKAAKTFFNGIEHALVPPLSLFSKKAAFYLLKRHLANPLQNNYIKQIALMTEQEISHASKRLSAIFDPEVFLKKFYKLNLLPQTIATYLYFDVKTGLPEQYLSPFEKIANAHGLQWKTPFLERGLEEYLASLPQPVHLKESEVGAYLKAMIQQAFPKFPFSSHPQRHTAVRHGHVMYPLLRETFGLLFDGFLVETGVISRSWLREQLALLETNIFVFDRIWAIFILELWFRMFVNDPIRSYPPTVSVKDFLGASFK